MVIKALFLILLGFSLFECSSHRIREPEFYGRWEGRGLSGHTEAVLVIGEDRIRIEFLTIPVSTTEHLYEASRDVGRLRIAIVGIEEPLWVVFDSKGNMHFDIAADGQAKVDAPRLTTLTFSKLDRSQSD